MNKPLGRKAYGSIGHISGSRLGSGDHTVSDGQTKICVDSHPDNYRVFVQTKLDGSCCSIAKLKDDSIIALGRAGYLAQTSKFEQHQLFAAYVRMREGVFSELLNPGERIVGEWLAQAHGTKYDLTGKDPFVAFDIMIEDKRFVYGQFMERVGNYLTTPDTIMGPIEPEEAVQALYHYGAESPEGVVYRAEVIKRKSWQVSFLAKYVRPGKEDGIYIIDHEDVWNIDKSEYL